MHALHHLAAAVLLVLSSGAAPLQAATPDQYLPDSTDVLLTINVRRLLDSGLLAPGTPKLREMLKRQQDLQAEFDAIGFDPFKDLETLAVAGVGSEGSDRVLVIAHGRFNFDKLIARAEKVRREQRELLKVEQENGCSYYVATPPGSDRPIYLGWPDSRTIVVSPFKPFIVHAFHVQKAEATPSLNRAASDLLAGVANTAAVSFIGLGTAFKDAPEAAHVRSIAGSLKIRMDMQLDATVALTDKQAAEQFETKVTERIHEAKRMVSAMTHRQKDLSSVASLFEAIHVIRQGDTVRLQAAVTQDMLAKPSQRTALDRPASPKRQATGRPRPQRGRQTP